MFWIIKNKCCCIFTADEDRHNSDYIPTDKWKKQTKPPKQNSNNISACVSTFMANTNGRIIDHLTPTCISENTFKWHLLNWKLIVKFFDGIYKVSMPSRAGTVGGVSPLRMSWSVESSSWAQWAQLHLHPASPPLAGSFLWLHTLRDPHRWKWGGLCL